MPGEGQRCRGGVGPRSGEGEGGAPERHRAVERRLVDRRAAMAMDVSVIIPTHGRPEKVAACARALAVQTLEPSRYEVLVGLDGPDEETVSAVRRAWGGAGPRLRVEVCERAGYSAVRNRLLERARGRVLVSMNDDVVPEPAFLATHLAEQEASAARGRPAIVVGNSPWKFHQPDRLIDRLIRDTSMVFFYHRMDASEPGRDWGFRHAWGLNCSMPLDRVRQIGGWTAYPLAYGYEDIELAYRLRERYGMPVLYRPAALAEHDHRYEPKAYLEREFKLGQSAWLFAEEHRAFARELFGRDITSEDELSYCRAFVERERSMAARLIDSFQRLADIPASAVEGPDAAALIDLLYEQHLLLKRWVWRSGVLAAAEGRHQDGVEWPTLRAAA